EEAKDSTMEQLEKTLRSMDNFHVAFNITRNSIERRINLHSTTEDSEEVKSAAQSVVYEIKKQDMMDYNMPFVRDFLGGEMK
ncbi:hypothetical protein PMAYCL1PPCAC_06065, partial [Pristionchus mayeri]